MFENARESGSIARTVAGRRGSGSDPVVTLFALSRRYDLAFSVVVARLCDPPAPESDGDRAARMRNLVECVSMEVRETDLIAESEGEQAVTVFCPATPSEGAKELGERLRLGVPGEAIGVGTATLASDGYLLEDLLAHAFALAHELHIEGGDDDRPPPSDLRPSPRPSRGSWRERMRAPIKRLFDLAVVVAVAPLWVPLAGTIALALKVAGPTAPVTFVQTRTGRGGRRFRMIKFRTMRPDAERLKASLLHRSERAWPDFKIDHDPRITRIGGWLRSTSLDELPQLLNVLRGDMSLVGPRPTSFAPDTYEPWQTARLDAVPGLTGLWQVEGRHEADFSERMRLDLRYVRNQSLRSDLKLLLRTVPVLWAREGR